MKIFKLSQGQMIQTNPSGTAQENINIQVQNLNVALPILHRFGDIITMTNDIHAKVADLGDALGEPGLADQVVKNIQSVIMENPEFKNLVQIGAVGSVQELFNTGVLSQKITMMTHQLQEAQQSQAQQTQAQQTQASQVQIG